MADPDGALTPEQRLLKLIEEQEKAEKNGAAASVASSSAAPVHPSKPVLPKLKFNLDVNWSALLSPSAIRGRLAFASVSLGNFFKGGGGELPLKRINKGMFILALILAGVIAVNLLMEFAHMTLDIRKQLQSSFVTVPEPAALLGAGDEMPAVEEFIARSIFMPVDKAQEAEKPQNEVSMKMLELTQQLKLTGISNNPQNPEQTFCMIEDLSKDTTLFLKQGDRIAGLWVQQIKTDSVVLKYENEEIEIR
ncbi:MAG: hypothetical protein ACOY3K_08970 [Candidatus Omnitrophota bacterium]